MKSVSEIMKKVDAVVKELDNAVTLRNRRINSNHALIGKIQDENAGHHEEMYAAQEMRDTLMNMTA